MISLAFLSPYTSDFVLGNLSAPFILRGLFIFLINIFSKSSTKYGNSGESNILLSGNFCPKLNPLLVEMLEIGE